MDPFEKVIGGYCTPAREGGTGKAGSLDTQQESQGMGVRRDATDRGFRVLSRQSLPGLPRRQRCRDLQSPPAVSDIAGRYRLAKPLMTSGMVLTEIQLHERRERVFLVLAGLFLGTLAMLNILGISRFILLATWGNVDNKAAFVWGTTLDDPHAWTFALAVGVLPYPLTFLCTDLISEFYGKRRANFVVWVGLLLNVWVVFIMWLGGVLPGFEKTDSAGKILVDEAGNLPVFFQVQALTFGAVTASMVAYLVAQFCDVHLYHFWKKFTGGRHLWLRNNGSTLVSQLVDTIAVILVTHFWARALPEAPEGRSLVGHLALFIVTGYAFKLVVAIFDTPVIYLAVRWLKSYLQIDPMNDVEVTDGLVKREKGIA